MMNIKVKAVGFGFNWTTYPVEFEFTMNGTQDSWEEGEIDRRIFSKVREKTACDKVEIKNVEITETV